MAKYQSRMKRRLILAILDHVGVTMWHCYSEYARALVKFGDGLTPKEHDYYHKRLNTMNGLCNDMSALHVRIFDEVKYW